MTSPLVLAPLLRLTFVLGEQAQRKQTLKHISMILELSEHKQHDKHFTLPKIVILLLKMSVWIMVINRY